MTENLELTRKVASDPGTAPALLAELGGSSDRITRQNVAANPNTPTEVLLKLGAEFPEQLLENPIFSLLLLENPNLTAVIPYDTLVNLLKCEIVPDSFMKWASDSWRGDRELALALAMNAKTRKNVLKRLLQNSYYSEVQEVVQLHVNFAGEMTESWDRGTIEAIGKTTFDGQQYRQYLEQLAQINSIPAFLIPCLKLLSEIAPEDDPSGFELDGKYRHTPVEMLPQLARRNLAKNTSTPVHILEMLAIDNNVEVRYELAKNPNTPVKILAQLATDYKAWVRYDLAKNPNVPASILSELASDTDAGVRRNVAANPNTPVEILSKLATDNNYGVRYSVASNPNTPVEILVELATDHHSYIRQYIAANPNTPVHILSKLATDSHAAVCQYIAANPNTPITLLQQLLSYDHERVLKFAVPRFLTHNLDKLSVVLQHYPKDSQPGYSRLVILFHPQVPANLLVENRRSDAWLERYAIAQHPNTPPDTLEILAKDANRIVRAAAKANQQTRPEASR